MDTYDEALALTAYTLGQKRGFMVGLVVGAAVTLYVKRYGSPIRKLRETPSFKTDYANGKGF